jgi:hypothetical protein
MEVTTDEVSERRERRDLSPLARLMQEFDPSLKAGRLKEAEAVLDRAMRLFDKND